MITGSEKRHCEQEEKVSISAVNTFAGVSAQQCFDLTLDAGSVHMQNVTVRSDQRLSNSGQQENSATVFIHMGTRTIPHYATVNGCTAGHQTYVVVRAKTVS
ncbi:hypothetical protein F2P81_012913 [Scophthalmus maximus]|uniref:Uncharacterized protein n=1 Tax=Scophthalmus maximus TaxID=52904 RepID=A0A6A4SRG9_SCOMX|nr:hypothetical protein F2P81_012913 [Scophthalmus maximus]